MHMRMYSVYDDKAGAYATPFFAANNGLALRMFSDLVNDQHSTCYAHPEDFSLYYIGEYDDQTGMITQDDRPHEMVRANDMKAEHPQVPQLIREA